MTFLTPGTGLVAAAVAVPVFLLLYFLKLRRRPLRVSTTMLWEAAAQDLQVNAPFRWLRVSVVFFLQLLALGCLLTAMARPALDVDAAGGARVVLVVDRSASMNSADGRADGRTRLDLAREEAKKFVERMARSGGSDRRTQAMVVEYSHAAGALTRFTDDTRELIEAIDSITPTDQEGNPGAAADLIRAMRAGESEGESARAGGGGGARTAAYFFSDGGNNLEGSLRELGGGVEARLVSVGGPTAPRGLENLGIAALTARRDGEQPTKVRLFVRLVNGGTGDVSTTLVVRSDERTMGLVPIKVGGASAGKLGTATASPEIELPGAAVVSVSIGRDDDLSADNLAGVSVPAPLRARVLVVHPAAEGTDAASESTLVRLRGRPDPFLMEALEALGLMEVRTVDAGVYERAIGDSASGLRNFDAVVFDRVLPSILPGVPTLSIAAGLPGSEGKPLVAVAALSDGHAWRGRTVRFVAWQRDHAVLRHVGLDTIIVSPPLQATFGEDAATVLARGNSGPLILEVGGMPGKPRRLVVAFELLQSNWGPDASFPIFISNAIEYLTAGEERSGAVSFTTAEPMVVTVAAGTNRLEVDGPKAWTVDVDTESRGSEVSLGVAERVGVYRVRGAVDNRGGGEAGAAVCVNLMSEAESGLAVGVASSPRGGEPQAGSGDESRGGESQGAGPGEVWHWFVMAAGVLLVIEWVVYGWQMRA